MSEWVWMRNDTTGGVTQFPVEAREGWEARGWVETEAPEDDDLTPEEKGVHTETPQEAPVAETATTEVPAVSGQEKKEKARG